MFSGFDLSRGLPDLPGLPLMFFIVIAVPLQMFGPAIVAHIFSAVGTLGNVDVAVGESALIAVGDVGVGTVGRDGIVNCELAGHDEKFSFDRIRSSSQRT
jgi:hypothetical protein